MTSPTERSISDDALITLVRKGATGVEDLLYLRLAPVVNRLVWSLLGPDSEHNDIAHDIFIRIFRGIGRVHDPARLEHWAARITINTVYNEMRRRTLRRWVFWSAPEQAEPPSPAVDLEGREVLAKTYEVLALLPQSERLVLSLALFEDQKLDSIAEDGALAFHREAPLAASARALPEVVPAGPFACGMGGIISRDE